MHDPVLESHHLVCEKPQTRRGIERRLALLLSATELFLEKGYDAVHRQSCWWFKNLYL